MSYSTTVEVDREKNVIQVSVVSDHGKEFVNRSLTRKKFVESLGKQKASLVASESCASAQYCARAAVRRGHDVRIIRNAVLAVAEAARRPNIRDAPMKSAEQQGLRAIR